MITNTVLTDTVMADAVMTNILTPEGRSSSTRQLQWPCSFERHIVINNVMISILR